MANQRVFLILALVCISFLMWEAWQKDYGPVPPQTVTQAGTGNQVTRTQSVPDEVTPDDFNELDIPRTSESFTAVTDQPVEVVQSTQSKIIEVLTDVLHVEIDTKGGTVSKVELLKYPVEIDKPDEPLTLFTRDPAEYYVAESGLLAESKHNLTQHTVLQAQQSSYTLQESQNSIDVVLTWVSPDGVVIDKVYTFERDSYVVKLTHRIKNSSAATWRGRQYTHLVRSSYDNTNVGGLGMVPTYTGGVVYNETDKYEKVDFEDMAESPVAFETKGGWAAMIQHYFVGAWIPDQSKIHAYYAKQEKSRNFRIGMASSDVIVPINETAELSATLFVGPKLQDRLEAAASGLELTVDYGFLTIISKPLFIVMDRIHSVIGNWGWSIVLVTLLLKALFFKLSEKSYRSMAGMRQLQPKLKNLKERYGDDKEKMKNAMMQMYKEEKINPLGGCLPILIQIPVFLALYWVLLESVELRHAPFMLWINDLSAQDPYYILPVLMGVSMFIQQKLNPAPVDPIQAKVMMVLPIVFTFFFLFFPAGLVLYWVVNNTLSIVQQWLIIKRVDGEKAKKKK